MADNTSLQLGEAQLATYLAARIPGFTGPIRATKFSTGQSNPTFLLETPARKYVLRMKPPGNLLKSAHAVEREYRVMQALAGTGVPVPQMLVLCEDIAVAGSVFYVMAHVEGRIFWDPALPGLSNAERAAIYESMNAALAALHSVDPAQAGLAGFGRPGNYFARQIARWSDQYRASETGADDNINRLIDWLPAPYAARRRRVRHCPWRLADRQFHICNRRPGNAGGAGLGRLHAKTALDRNAPAFAPATLTWHAVKPWLLTWS